MWKCSLLIFLILNSSASSERPSNISTNNDENLINLTNAHSAAPQSLNFEKSNLLFLSEMPLEQLLKVKKSIEEIQQVGGLNYNRNHATETLTTAGTTLESRIINEEPSSNFELGHGKFVKSSAMPLININQQTQQPQQQQQQSTLNRLN